MAESFEWESAERYGKELDEAAEILQSVHYMGKVKAFGRLEVVTALKEIVEELKQRRADAGEDGEPICSNCENNLTTFAELESGECEDCNLDANRLS